MAKRSTARGGTPEQHHLITSSAELGLAVGSQQDLDAVAAQFKRRDLVLRITAVLSGLWADESRGFRTINESFAKVHGPAGARLRKLLTTDSDAVFLEPLQQLIFLRRALTVASEGEMDSGTPEGFVRYFDGSRFASDISMIRLPDDAAKGTETTLRIAADFLKRLSILNPPHPTNSLARLRLMFRDLPKRYADAGPLVERLRQRFADAFGLTFDDVSRLAQLLTLWSLRFRSFDELLKQSQGQVIELEPFLSKVKLDRQTVIGFFERTARPIDEDLSDASLGGSQSILPFRDRPFVVLEDEKFVSIYPALLSEKLTHDMLWWTARPGERQAHPWQTDEVEEPLRNLLASPRRGVLGVSRKTLSLRARQANDE